MAKVTLDRETFKALASETRLDLLRSLDERRKTGTELARDLQLNKATVHEHLQVLSQVGLVNKADEGRKWIYYELTWQGRKLLHPEQGATFAVLLALSTLSAGGAFAMLGKALDWWLEGGSGDGSGPQTLNAPADDRSSGESNESVAADAPPEEGMAMEAGDGGFFDDGGWIMLALLAATLLFFVLAWVLRRGMGGRRSRPPGHTPDAES